MLVIDVGVRGTMTGAPFARLMETIFRCGEFQNPP